MYHRTDTPDLNQQQVAVTAEVKTAPPPPTWASKVPCRYFKHGMCRNGANCFYYHAENFIPSATPVCRYFLTSGCVYGDNCRYSHVRSTPAKPSSDSISSADNDGASIATSHPASDLSLSPATLLTTTSAGCGDTVLETELSGSQIPAASNPNDDQSTTTTLIEAVSSTCITKVSESSSDQAIHVSHSDSLTPKQEEDEKEPSNSNTTSNEPLPDNDEKAAQSIASLMNNPNSLAAPPPSVPSSTPTATSTADESLPTCSQTTATTAILPAANKPAIQSADSKTSLDLCDRTSANDTKNAGKDGVSSDSKLILSSQPSDTNVTDSGKSSNQASASSINEHNFLSNQNSTRQDLSNQDAANTLPNPITTTKTTHTAEIELSARADRPTAITPTKAGSPGPASPKSPKAEEWVKAKEFVPRYQVSPPQGDYTAQSYYCFESQTDVNGHPTPSPVASFFSYAQAAAAHVPSPVPSSLFSGQSTSALLTHEEIEAAKSSLCPYAVKDLDGACPFTQGQCSYLHPARCDYCGKFTLHPTDEQVRQEHINDCMALLEDDMEHAFAVQRSQDKQCGICMETVLEKPRPKDRRFGILNNCVHTFCLACIRKWRGAKNFDSKVIRSCPECRTKSDFVTPSPFWVEEEGDKQRLIADYKKALNEKPCKYFDEGRGECPFFDKCFYRHAYPDGKIASPKPRPKKRHVQGGNSRDASLAEILNQVMLWNFLDDSDDDFFLTDWLDEFSGGGSGGGGGSDIDFSDSYETADDEDYDFTL